MKLLTLIFTFFLLFSGFTVAQEKNSEQKDINKFAELLLSREKDKKEALKYIKNNWKPSFAIMMLEVIYLNQDSGLTSEFVELLEKKTGKNFGYETDKWYEWIWNKDEDKHPKYADFKGIIYSIVDPRFNRYFDSDYTTKIRLDEVRWGGVRQDGIPPLRNPKMITAKEATYLDDSNIVFAIEVNGDARAYPKRIMGWHEMFVGEVGEIPVAGVYCTLCGTMILYKTNVNGLNHEMGTSGFLYRSNKLMYDKETQSLWNTIWGRPVIGPLADKNIELERMSVVTTTWSEWKKRHPGTKVLSLDTGYSRDYGEGRAYKEYFANDNLMFTVPKTDSRLKNKDEILGLIFSKHPESPFAISTKYLSKNPIYHNKVGDMNFVVLTDSSGASRVYESNGVKFRSWDQNATAIDESNSKWTLTESKLESSNGKVLNRLPAHRAFWFGWYSAYSNTDLVY